MSKYINQLSDCEIENFFNANGYDLIKNRTDKNGIPLCAIERSEDNIFVRVKQSNNNTDIDLDNPLIKKSSTLMALSTLAAMHGVYGNKIDLIFFSDYYLSKFCITPEDETTSEELCNAYIKYMATKFPSYKNDFLIHCNSLENDEQTM